MALGAACLAPCAGFRQRHNNRGWLAAPIVSGAVSREDSPLKNAPHMAAMVLADRWDLPYTRETAAFPAPWVRGTKFWPTVGRIDNVHGDRNLICTCPLIAG